MGPLILITGPGGSGTPAMARAAVRAMADEGLDGLVVEVGQTPDDPGAGDPAASLVASTLGRVLGQMGADPLPPLAWAGLPGLDLLSALLRAQSALAEPDVDVVVLDCGPLAQAERLVGLPAMLVRMLEAALTPATAMWRDTEEPSVFEALSRARGEAVRLANLLERPQTSLRCVTSPDEAGARAAVRAAAVFPVLGVGVDGIVLTGAPRRGDHPRRAERHDLLAARLAAIVDPVTVWTSARRPRPAPRGRSAAGPLPMAPRLVASALTASAHEGGYRLSLPLPGPADVRVGVHGDDVVVDAGRVTRWLALPPVLQRCRATGARREDAGVVVDFVPEPGLWPRGGA